MPVLSPHRSSASGLSGSYRSTFSSSPLEMSYFSTSASSYNPRIGAYSERYTSRYYSDSEGRRGYSRSASITEDGVTTRFREDSRDGSVRRDSSSRDGSYRENSISDYPRRESSLTRNDRLSALNVIDSVAELRNKYSPANYVPTCLRKNDNISRSKSINDIGLPPIESKSNKKKVNEALNCNNSVLYSNNTNNDNMTIEDDDNGNRASVADLCRKFDEKSYKCAENAPLQIEGAAVKISENRFKKNDQKPANSQRTLNGIKTKKSNGDLKKNGSSELVEANDTSSLENCTSKLISDENGIKGGHLEGGVTRTGSRVNNFASYIPVTNTTKCDANEEVPLVNGAKESLENDELTMRHNDLAASPNLSRSTISPSNSNSNSSNNTNCSRRSSDREPRRIDYGDEEGERNYNKIRGNVASPVKTLGLNGLKNIGNTCFMNSVIQCLSNSKLLLEYVRKDGYMRDINTSISSMKGALMKAFAEVLKELWSEDASDRVVNTVSLKSQIQRFAPRFIGYAQQDAQEFLRYLLEGLHEDVNRVTEKPKPILTEIDDSLSDAEKSAESWSRYLRMDNSRIVDDFVGQLKSTLKCTHCGHCSVTFDPFWDLSLPMPQRTGQLRLAQCLESFTREETLDGDEKPTCAKCKERRKCTKSFSIQKFPKILVIHLKRFSPTERFRGKLNVIVDFPLEGLDMSNYAADSIAPCRYNLYAISNHSGTTYSGHYTAYCRHPYTKTWHEYNDSRVSSISPKSIVSGEAYVLFYEQEGQKSHL